MITGRVFTVFGLATFLLSPLAMAPLSAASQGAVQEEVPAFDAQEAFSLLKAQVEMGPRNPGSKGHAACLQWLRRELKAAGARIQEHPFSVKDPYGEGSLHLTNLKASFGPRGGSRVALAAHWDTRPRADQQPGGGVDRPIPGANDGASGVAVLMELARVLHEYPLEELGVDLLFFDGEDYGREGDTSFYLLGSKRFQRDFPEYRPRLLILLDMVGGKNLSISMERNGLQRAPELTYQVFSRAAELGLGAFVNEPGPALLDDHIPFLLSGIPAVDLIDFDYPQWHTLQDDPAACSPRSLEQVGKLLLALLYQDFSSVPARH